MKLTKSDIETLKQVSLVNCNLLIRKGSKKVMSITPMKTVFFVGELSDVPSYEYDLCLYSIEDLIFNLKFFDEKSDTFLNVKKDIVEITQVNGDKKLEILQSDKSIVIAPTKEPEVDDLCNYNFNLPKERTVLWTVNNELDFQRYLEIDLYGVVTDIPDTMHLYRK